MGGIFPQEFLLLLLLRMQEGHAHEDFLLLGNTQEEAQAGSVKACLGSWEMQEELEEEIKLSVGKQPSPVAVLCLQGSPDPLPICAMPRTRHFRELSYHKDLGNQFDFCGCSWWMWGAWRGVRSLGGLCTVLGILARGVSLCPCAARCRHGMGRVLGEQAG